jgi:uncharacterized protein YjeT (DUF2065 family)
MSVCELEMPDPILTYFGGVVLIMGVHDAYVINYFHTSKGSVIKL